MKRGRALGPLVIAVAIVAIAIANRHVYIPVLAAQPRPFIAATPNPATSGEVIIRFQTGDGSVGQVYVNGGSINDTLFAQGASGSQIAPWIQPGARYVFTLYADTDHKIPLASVTVTRDATP